MGVDGEAVGDVGEVCHPGDLPGEVLGGRAGRGGGTGRGITQARHHLIEGVHVQA